LYGSKIGIDDKEIDQRDLLADKAKTALDLIIKRAHDHDPNLTNEQVRVAIDHARYQLNAVLRIYLGRRE
jgi:hypothetical protein